MPSRPRQRVAVLGAGPIGLEAALYAAALGHDVRVYERGRVGGNVRRWGFVRMFSPWEMNRSPLGLRELASAGLAAEAADAFPTGAELVERYLDPLAASPRLRNRIHERHAALRIGREGLGKSDLVGGPRDRHPFRILLETPGGERIERADVVLDCTGTYGRSNRLGNGNIPALGERALQDRIGYTLQDVAGAGRAEYEGQRVLLVGGGHSAATALEALSRLRGTSVVWVVRSDRRRPLPELDGDPLPERDRLSRLANDLACGASPDVECRRSTAVERIARRGDRLEVELSRGDSSETVVVDRILAHVGYRPDRSLYRELQVHECYASMGPIRLAATLLGSASEDCLDRTSAGADALRNPEPGFFILGAKSYGMQASFLIRVGLQQIREVFSLIDGDPGLNLYEPDGETAVSKES